MNNCETMLSLKNIYATAINMNDIEKYINGKATGMTTTTAKFLKGKSLSNLMMAKAFVAKMRGWKTRNAHRLATDHTVLSKEIKKEFKVLPPPVKGVVSSIAHELTTKKGKKKTEAELQTPEVAVYSWGEDQQGKAEEFDEGDQYNDRLSDGSGVDDWEQLWDDDDVVEEKKEEPIRTPTPTVEKVIIAPTPTKKGWGTIEVAEITTSKDWRKANPPLSASRSPSPVNKFKPIGFKRTGGQKERREQDSKVKEWMKTPLKVQKVIDRSAAFKKMECKPCLKKTRPCRHVLNGKTCRRGKTCSFAHTCCELTLVPCAFGERCRKKNRCTYFHAETETKEEYVKRFFPTLPM